jgi:hypothetical protein
VPAVVPLTAGEQASFTGSIVGTVTDPSRGVVPRAEVVVTNVGTNEGQEVQTDTSGTYFVPNLKPGVYRLEVSASGFKRFAQSGITLPSSAAPVAV